MIVEGQDKGATSPAAEQPPPYAAPASSSATGFSPPQLQKSNFLAIHRRDSIKGSYVVDPDLNIPDAMLAPIKDGDERKNLLLVSTSEGVKADVWLVPRAPGAQRDAKRARATLDVRGRETVSLRLYAGDDRPFALSATSDNESVLLELPRGFVGPLTLSTARGCAVSFSPALEPDVATFYDVEDLHLRKCFVGDFAAAGFGSGEWLGGSIDLKAREKIKIRYVDEAVDKPKDKDKSKSKTWGWGIGVFTAPSEPAPAPAPRATPTTPAAEGRSAPPTPAQETPTSEPAPPLSQQLL